MTGRELKLLGNDLAELTPYLDAGAERLIDEAEFYATNTVQLVKALQRGAHRALPPWASLFRRHYTYPKRVLEPRHRNSQSPAPH